MSGGNGRSAPQDGALRAWMDRAAAASRSPDPSTLYRTVESALADLVGFRLMTVLQVERGRLVRRHSSALDRYPAGGSKEIAGDAWLEQLLERGVPRISDGEEEVRERFFDHDAIFAIGCRSVLNVPVRAAGRSLGSVNLLHEPRHFAQEHARLVLPFARAIGSAWLASA